jgi:S1-C subfamily serine protease
MKHVLFFAFLCSFSMVTWSQCIRGNCFNGQGTYSWPDGQKYVGQFKDGERNGQGTFTFADGRIYVGQWKDEKRNGQGTQTWPDGQKYVGQYKDGKKHGQGTYSWPDGQKYVGQYKDGKKHGQGTYTWPNGQKYVGQYKDGERNEGKELVYDGERTQLNYWQNGEIINRILLTRKDKAEIISEQTNAAHSLLSSLGYGMGQVSVPPNALMISALSSYCKSRDAFKESCPDLSKVDLRVDDLLAALQSSVLQKQTQLESAEIISTGSAFRVNALGSLVTNSHVVNGCLAISDQQGNYYKKAIDNEVQDLAVLDIDSKVTAPDEKERAFALLSDNEISLGETIYVAGFPYAALLKNLNFTEGTISSVSGIGGNTQHFQITAPMQPGNSGGPILSETGAVLGVAVGKLNASMMVKLGGGLPQNVNFGIDIGILKKMLENNSIPFEEGSPFFSFFSDRKKVAIHAKDITEQINCWGQK